MQMYLHVGNWEAQQSKRTWSHWFLFDIGGGLFSFALVWYDPRDGGVGQEWTGHFYAYKIYICKCNSYV